MDVEKFIECVKKYPILYNTRHKDFKNALKKEEIWELIARETNETSEVLRTKWKGLKDGYTKFKKQTKGSSRSAKGYINWCWGPNLAFLDNFKKQRESTSNIYTAPQDDISNSSSSQSVFTAESPSQQIAAHTSHVTLASPQEEIFLEQLEPILSTSPTSTPEPSASGRRESRRQVFPEKTNKDDIDKLFNMQNKRIKTSDAVDDLFNSYTKTFKTFSITTQSLLKVELAKLFADAELREHNMINSPEYSLISVDSDNNKYSTTTKIEPLSPTSINMAAPTTSRMDNEYNYEM